mgnify:CR=1 FL=1
MQVRTKERKAKTSTHVSVVPGLRYSPSGQHVGHASTATQESLSGVRYSVAAHAGVVASHFIVSAFHVAPSSLSQRLSASTYVPYSVTRTGEGHSDEESDEDSDEESDEESDDELSEEMSSTASAAGASAASGVMHEDPSNTSPES